MQSVLVVSYDHACRTMMTEVLQDFGVETVPCSSFVEAECYAMLNQVSGVIVDVATMVRAKGDEQSISTSLQNVYPLIRVRVSDSAIKPMFVGRNDNQNQGPLVSILEVYASFLPRTLRKFKRSRFYLPVVLRKTDGHEYKTITTDLSWGGAFIALNTSWGLAAGEMLLVQMPTLNISVEAQIARCVAWGTQNVIPGLGVTWSEPLEPEIEEGLLKVLKHDRAKSRDTIVG